ncbi:MAG TPA: carboxypeptidase regulatory-like domain-containing protein [Myxococcaceae bacterium]|nr:carboxypeptidase regulatory-like domain-containing protein [Myxococcaceae bacterium]
MPLVVGAVALALVAWLGWSFLGSRDASSSQRPSSAAPASSSPGAPSARPGSSAGGSATAAQPARAEGETQPVSEPMHEGEGTLRIEVNSPRGPQAGAQVTLYQRGPYEPLKNQPTWRLAGTGTTDDTGALVLPARVGRYLVSARAEGFAAARAEVTRPRGEARTPVRLTLAPGVTIDGTTVERASRNPVPLVELVLTPRPSSLGELASAPAEELHHGSSDTRGAFRFEGLAPGEYQFEAKAPGNAPKRLARVHAPSSVTVELEASAFLEGFVELPDGKPAVGATVSALGADEAVVAETGEGGGFSLDVAPGVYQVAARQGEKTGSQGAVVGAGMTVKGLRIRLGASTSITGLVREKGSGAPIADATISLSPRNGQSPIAQSGAIAQGSSGEDGRFELSGLAPGAYVAAIQARGFKVLRRQGITLLEGQRFELIADLEAHGRIEGTVVDGAKAPVAGVQLSAHHKWRPMTEALPAVSDAEGRFVLEVPAGDVFVAAARPGSAENARVLVKVEPGQTHRLRIELTEEGNLEGTVRLSGGGVPPRPVTIFAHRVGTPVYEGVEVPTLANGTFSMRIRAGRYQLSAWMADARGLDTEEKTVTLEAGRTQRVDLEVREAKRPITLTVLEPNGAPSVGAVVMGSEAGKSNILLEDLTDAAGRVTLVSDSLGSNELHLWATNGGRSGALPRVPAASPTVTIQLTPGGRLAGTVRSAGGRPVNGFKLLVAAVRTDEDYVAQEKFEFTGDQFLADDIAPGRVAITATLPDGRAGKVEATATSGGTTRVELVVDAGATLTGRLLDARSGEPISQGTVDVDGLLSPATGPDGRFRVEDVAPGAHRVTAWSRQHEILDKQVTLTAGKVLDLGDWRLGPPRVEPGRLGLSFGMSGTDVTITGIAPGAAVGELQLGDVLTAIDGVPVLTPGEARQRELGAPGSPITLSIRRDGQPRTLSLTRAP